ncbi:hypothetical protein AVEN_144065-1 [Araneus ventricosus]|uniref:Uncharacterized protein n=1 Tax=Araneus ventricosus TaxID=182803 RepID=A0A4Y2DHE6_ARAVE|nr:hypothetical protein AVEN_144065-1 [Araneus ventricosus]
MAGFQTNCPRYRPNMPRQLSASTGTSVSRQTTYRLYSLYVRRLLFWRGIILGPRTNLTVQCGTMIDQIYQYIILQHKSCVQRYNGSNFVYMDDNAHPSYATIVDKCLEEEDITHME